MNYKFLHRVIDQIVSETEIDYDEERLYPPSLEPFSLPLNPPIFRPFIFSSSLFPFYRHCKEVYGLSNDEIDYVWEEYRNIIKDKINNEL